MLRSFYIRKKPPTMPVLPKKNFSFKHKKKYTKNSYVLN